MKVPIRSLAALGWRLQQACRALRPPRVTRLIAPSSSVSRVAGRLRHLALMRVLSSSSGSRPGQSSHRSRSGAVRWEWRSKALHRFFQWNGSTTSPSRPSRRSACRLPQFLSSRFKLTSVQTSISRVTNSTSSGASGSITSSSAGAKIVMAIASALTARALVPTAPKETITGHVRVWPRFLRHLTFLALGAADPSSATDRSSSIGGTMPATTASKKSDTEPSRASVALACSFSHLHRRLCTEPKRETTPDRKA